MQGDSFRFVSPRRARWRWSSPCGHILGQANQPEPQRRVILSALEVLESASGPDTIAHFPEPWPEPFELAKKASHPETPPPIAAEMGRYIGKFLLGIRRDK